MSTMKIKLPYVIFLGDIQDKTLVKTGAGLAKWCGDDVLGQLRLPSCAVDLGHRVNSCGCYCQWRKKLGYWRSNRRR